MSRRTVVDLFVEDQGHEAFLAPLITRIAGEEGFGEINIRRRSVRGGHGRAIREFVTYQRLVERGAISGGYPDLVVTAIDGNCSTFTGKRQEILQATTERFRDRLVAACPDPHIEKWYLADPEAFARVVGPAPPVGKRKCERDHYKNLLSSAVRDAGYPATLGGIEFAKELAEEMDLYRAGRNDRSLKAFVDDLRARLRSLAMGR